MAFNQQPKISPEMANILEDPPVPDDVLERIRADMTAHNERPIDYVRRISEAVIARRNAFSHDQLFMQFTDFAIRYHRLFEMICDPDFDRTLFEALLQRWQIDMGGATVSKETADKNAAYHRQSRNWGEIMSKKYIEPVMSKMEPPKKKEKENENN